MKFPRAAGILLHPTSLPGPYGIGDFGAEAFRFADFLHDAGLKIWQMLPLNPTGFGDSPYQSFSAFAGNPLLISLDLLAEDGLLDERDLRTAPQFMEEQVDFAAVIPWKSEVLLKAAERFFASASSESQIEFGEFARSNATWLDDFALFMAAKATRGGIVWTDWDSGLAARSPDAISRWTEKLGGVIAAHKFWQYEFFRQFSRLKRYCSERDIRIMGDIPIYVAHDSADVWANRHLFYLDEHGRPEKVAGVPPDYFSATGQLWGNPIYRWDVMKQNHYAWWITRVRASLATFDMVRLDHFRGFEAYWEIPAGEPTAVNGRWVKGPGSDLFRALTKALGPLPIVAENLGVITPEVEAIRHEFDYPGMAILQFAFSTDQQAPTFRPHNYVHNQVAYTGGHDNDTMFGWWHSGVADSTRSEDDVRKEYEDAIAYFGVGREVFNHEVNWVFIRGVMMSVADTALFPMQDVLGLGSEARMNVPATLGRNWKWRMRPHSLLPEHRDRLASFARMYGR